LSKPTREQIKAIKAKYNKINKMNDPPLHSKHEFMVSNLAKHGLLNSRMNAKAIAFSHKKNFGGVGKVETAFNPKYMGFYNTKGIRDDKESSRNFRNRDSTRYGQGAFGLAVPKGDRRSGRQEYNNSKRKYEDFAGKRK
jgi:hypothetical protein